MNFIIMKLYTNVMRNTVWKPMKYWLITYFIAQIFIGKKRGNKLFIY